MKNIILLNDNLTDKYIFWRDSPPNIIAINANKAPNNVVITITLLLSYLSDIFFDIPIDAPQNQLHATATIHSAPTP